MPASKQHSPRFRTIQTVKPDYVPVTITQYESTRTGLRIAVVDRKGPKVEGDFALATEIHDNSGAPHTLEHLIFMGSKSYRYCGLLDRLASRAFSNTNAWTDTDCTSYSLKTAGWEGFKQMLPVYLEHLIVPTLTDPACYTEVHHIDGAGHDAGVVYSEMQGRENSSQDIMELQRRRLMYPDGSGFRYETGGMTKELRVLTADRIRAFHKEMYQPKNLRVILTGEIDHDELLEILDDFETSILEDVPTLEVPFRRPWVESKPTPPLRENKVETIKFPEEDESMGELTIGYLGPKCTDTLGNAALTVLLSYLDDSPISVLENTLVEKEQLCSAVYYDTQRRPDVEVWFDLTSIETDKLEDVYHRFLEVLKGAAEKPLDMNYMHDCIKRQRRSLKERAESAEDFFTQPIVEDHLYCDREGNDLATLSSLKELDIVEGWSEKQWKHVLRKFFVDNHHVAVIGVPSKELSKKNTADEKARVEAQKSQLGEKGLQELAKKLDEAKAQNGKVIPEDLLESFPLPRPENLNFFPTTTARAGAARQMGKLDNDIQKIIDKADDGSPLFFHFEHIPSNFVHFKIYMGTRDLPTELRPILPLYLTNFFTTPLYRDGKRIEFEAVVSSLESETITYYHGSAYENMQMLCLGIQTEPDSYATVITHIRDFLFNSIHDHVRLHASLTKIMANIPSEKREGDAMLWAVSTMISTTRDSNTRAENTLTKALYLKRLRKLLKRDPESVVNKLQDVFKILHRPENFRIFVAADITKLPNPISAWQNLTKDISLEENKPLEPLDDLKSTLNDVGRNHGSAAYIIPMPAIDSSYLALISQGPDSYTHPDIPALMVAIAYMRAVEGPLWTAVRGTGLAYGAYIGRSTSLGEIHFSASSSPDCYKAYVAAKGEIDGYASGEKELKKSSIESAVGEIVYMMAEEGATMGRAAAESFSSQVIKGLPKDYKHTLLKKLGEVTRDEVKSAIEKYLVPLFNPSSANLIATCAGIMEENMVKNFKEAGFKVESKPIEFFQDDYGLEEPEGDDDEEEDEEEDDDEEDDEKSNEEDDEKEA